MTVQQRMLQIENETINDELEKNLMDIQYPYDDLCILRFDDFIVPTQIVINGIKNDKIEFIFLNEFDYFKKSFQKTEITQEKFEEILLIFLKKVNIV